MNTNVHAYINMHLYPWPIVVPPKRTATGSGLFGQEVVLPFRAPLPPARGTPAPTVGRDQHYRETQHAEEVGIG